MTADSLEPLRSLRDRIAALRVTRCRMLHERVRIENGAVVRVSRGEPEPALVRIGLCSSEARARNLACGHTMARYLLLDAVQALHGAGGLPGAAYDHLRESLDAVSNDIHLLDHRKGDAEKRSALSSERDLLSSEEPAAEVRRLEAQHDACAERIRELHGTVLALLDAAITDGSARGDEVPCPA